MANKYTAEQHEKYTRRIKKIVSIVVQEFPGLEYFDSTHVITYNGMPPTMSYLYPINNKINNHDMKNICFDLEYDIEDHQYIVCFYYYGGWEIQVSMAASFDTIKDTVNDIKRVLSMHVLFSGTNTKLKSIFPTYDYYYINSTDYNKASDGIPISKQVTSIPKPPPGTNRPFSP